jgi:C4-dicarboxylate-specific signal transduction histidine kinase
MPPRRPSVARPIQTVAGRPPTGAPASGTSRPAPSDHRLSAFTDTFAYLSHVLRTPVTSLAAAVANLQDAQVGDLCPAAERSLAVCQRNVERLRSTIERIEELVALEAHSPSLRAAPLTCADLVTKIRRWMERMRHDELKRLQILVPEPDALVVTDGARLGQLLAQFLGAAVALTDARGIVTAQVEIVTGPGEAAILRCCAQGLGTSGAQGLTLPEAGTERVAALDRLLRLELSDRLLRAFGGRLEWSHQHAAWIATLELPAVLPESAALPG